jgi:hypothetical protein
MTAVESLILTPAPTPSPAAWPQSEGGERPSSPPRPLGTSVIHPDRVRKNARAAAEFAGTLEEGALRRSYLAAMMRIQPARLDFRPDEDEILIDFDPKSQEEKETFALIMSVDALPEGWAYPLEERPLIAQRIRDALALIGEMEPELLRSIHTLVGSFLMARMEGFDGGSLTNVVGAIWMAMPPSRPVVDFAEFIVHEFVHQALFLEDMVHCVFLDGEAGMAESDLRVTSAIQKIPRGYDKSFHSAFVAFTLSRFFERLDLPERVGEFLEPLRVTVPELGQDTRFLTDHGRVVLGELAAALELNGGETPRPS